MFATLSSKTSSSLFQIGRRAMSSSSSAKVAVLGAAGGIGQPLSMLLKLSPVVDELTCYDIVGAPGVAADLAHVSQIKKYKQKTRKKDSSGGGLEGPE